MVESIEEKKQTHTQIKLMKYQLESALINRSINLIQSCGSFHYFHKRKTHPQIHLIPLKCKQKP